MAHDSPQCTLEPVPKSEIASSYIYSVPDITPPYPIQGDAHNNHINHPDEPTTSDDLQLQPQRPSSLLRWPCLILYAILVAVIAGVAGGFIGKDITTKTCSQELNAAMRSAPLSSSPTPVSASPTSSSSATSTFERKLSVPTTGCTPTTQQRTFKSVTTYLAFQYNTYCATGWLNDDLIAMSAATPSDCVEACVMYNSRKRDQDRSCVGGGFIPAWWNQSKAADEDGGMPYNCFLKSNDTGTGRNNKDVEVVSLCLPGSCKDVISP